MWFVYFLVVFPFVYKPLFVCCCWPVGFLVLLFFLDFVLFFRWQVVHGYSLFSYLFVVALIRSETSDPTHLIRLISSDTFDQTHLIVSCEPTTHLIQLIWPGDPEPGDPEPGDPEPGDPETRRP